ncbi:hypothetical protein NUU61_003103, partial [Penicillium alfredii]
LVVTPLPHLGSLTLLSQHGKSQYGVIEHVEDLDRYRLGGFHPLHIGDRLNDGRYQLVDKLGYGGYSTIWLTRDLQGARYVAIKVTTSDSSGCPHEARLIRSFGNSPARPGREIIPRLIDELWVAGPNGRHRYIVTPPAQMSFHLGVISTQGRAVNYCTNSFVVSHFFPGKIRCTVVHLHLGNILIQFPEAKDYFSTFELYERFGEPESEAVVRLDGEQLSNGVPGRVFMPGWFGVHSNDRLWRIFNPNHTYRLTSKTLPLFQPPEARFSGEPLSFVSDIWTLACTVWEILGQRPLFEAFSPTADRVTAEQVEVLARLYTSRDKHLIGYSRRLPRGVQVGSGMALHKRV